MTISNWRDEKWAKDVPGPIMSETLDNIQADDKKAPMLSEAVIDARYVLGLYSEGGTQAKRAATSEVRKLKKFIEKYST